jgi:2-amino-4-hydroxy-6-hydroxymethyldihydropteridine diphosphokinase
MMNRKDYIISLGSNMGDSKEILHAAIKKLSANPGLRVLKLSSFYRTKPWGKTDQPDFLNAAALVRWKGTPEELLAFLLLTEKEMGRVRKVHWGPRTLDLDLIYNEYERRDTEYLHLPHPLFWARPFVLVPMEEILPEFTFGGEGIHERILSLHGYAEVKREWTEGKENENGY